LIRGSGGHSRINRHPRGKASLSNHAASAKLPELDRHGRLVLNRDFGGGRTTWTEQDIRDRTLKLFKIAKTLWPGP